VVNEYEYCTENLLEVYDLPDERIRAIEQRRFEPFEKRERDDGCVERLPR